MKFPRVLLTFLSLLLILSALPARAATAEPTSSAMEWLMLLDEGQYAQSWGEGSQYFRTRITARGWQDKAGLFRDAVGKIVKREFDGVSLVGKVANLPESQYAVVRFKSQFSDKKDCIETVTLAQEGKLWRVVTYAIK